MDELIYVNVATATISLPAALGTTRKIVLVKTHATAGHVTVSPDGTDTIEAFDDAGMYRQYDKLILVDYTAGKWAILNHGDFTIISADDRSATISDPSVSDTWETADLSSYVRKGTKALFGYAYIRTDSTQDRMLIVTRGPGESEGATGNTHTLHLQAEIGSTGYIYIGTTIIIYAPDGKFEYRRYNSSYPVGQFYFDLWGYFI
jgi:hypothetical protein